MIGILFLASLIAEGEAVLGNDAPARMHPTVDSLVLKAGTVWAGPDRVFSPGAVVVMDGEILAVGEDPGEPVSPRVVDLGEDAVITAGLIDAACQLGVESSIGFSEQSTEVIAHLSVRDSVDLYSESLETLAREGVTTVFVTPEAASVVGSQGVVVKTGGAGFSRFVDSPTVIKANLGPETSRRGSSNRPPSRFGEVTFNARRPTTRMGSSWEFRYAFHNAKRFAAGKSLPTDAVPESMPVLVDVMAGNVGLRFQARKRHDIDSAYRLCDEAGVASFVLEYAQEAYHCLDRIQARGTSVVYGPLFIRTRGLSGMGDNTEPQLGTPKLLAEREIPFCLTACDGTGETGLRSQASSAWRFGLDADRALLAVTKDAADILGIGDRVGVLERGRDADLVVWSGPPLQATAQARLVLIDGKSAFDPEGLLSQ